MKPLMMAETHKEAKIVLFKDSIILIKSFW